ncbi:hypothetical protein [Clostridium sp. C2-6-12]|uniref:hypothetical protein n=1 Tax=Clostridium sp. C2-6-12 TaxID=2698832 RepID=UPI00136A7BE3|nr:hypothetical protein [Clostridium sp. C2-6-12]
MKFNDAFNILKTIEKAVNDPNFIADSLKKSQLFSFPNNSSLNNATGNNIYAESVNANNQVTQSASANNNTTYENNNYENADYYNKTKTAFSNEQGLLDSITQDLTSVRLQQAIILSEIVGKPKSKTRKRRRY